MPHSGLFEDTIEFEPPAQLALRAFTRSQTQGTSSGLERGMIRKTFILILMNLQSVGILRGSVLMAGLVLGSFAGAQTTPVITAISAPRQVVTLGQSLTLSVIATDATSYQWRRNGIPLAGATNASHAITNATPLAHNGWYQAVATNANGATTSATVFVLVRAAASQLVRWGTSVGTPAGFSDVVAIASSYSEILGLKSDGTVVSIGGYSIPTGLSNVVAIAAGANGSHFLALKADGTVIAWGSNSYGQTDVPAGLSNVVAVAAGNSHSIAVRGDGSVVAWGNPATGTTSVPAGLSDAVAAAAGVNYSLVLRADGSVVGWGSNANGQSSIPFGLSNVIAVASGGIISLALRSNGTVVAWGYNRDGGASVPSFLTNVVGIGAGYYHCLAVKNDGTVFGWGRDSEGQSRGVAGLGNVFAVSGDQTGSAALRDASGDIAPAIVTQPADVIAYTGQDVTLRVGVSGGTALLNYQWQKAGVPIARATNASLLLPRVTAADAGSYSVAITNWLGSVTSLSATLSVNAAAAVTLNHSGRQTLTPGQSFTLSASSPLTAPVTYQWRRNGRAISGATDANLTIASASWRDVGVCQVVATNAIGSALSAGVFVAVATPSAVIAWGQAGSSQSTVPAGLSGVLAVAAGDGQGLALKSDGTVTGWGQNVAGSLSGLSDVIAVSAGGYRSMALRLDGTVVSWGEVNYTPNNLTDVIAIAASSTHNLALRSNGTVIEWDTVGVRTDVPLGLDSVVAIGAGYQSSLAVKADGSVVGWGSGTPAAVPDGIAGIVAVAVGQNHALGLKADGSVVAWGANDSGQTTVPPGLSSVVAIAAYGGSSYALKADGSVVAWGSNWSGQVNVPTNARDVFSLSAGNGFALAARDTSGDALPVITTQPASLTIAPGQPATLRVNATGTGTLTYQWYQGTSGTTTPPISGATKASYATPALTATTNYWVKVTDALGSTNSSTTTVTVSASTPPMSATHAVVGPGYLAGGTVTITNTVTYTGSPSRIDWSALLPGGWGYVGGGGSEGNVKPETGAVDLLEWTWTTVPPSPFTFTYTLNVPAGTTGSQPITALVSSVQAGVQYQSLASVDPLIVSKAVLHSADTNGDGKISLFELTRVIELYNHRFGTVRTGQYHAQAGTEDGFAPGP